MKKKRVMVVDDNEDVTFSIKDFLEAKDSSLEVIRCKDGDECIRKVKSQKPDVLLLDIMMPKTDGWTVAKKLKERKQTSDIPIIFVTARTDNLSKNLGGLIASEYVEKPFDTTKLYKKVKKILNSAC